ncbi:pyruvate formate lyase activating enzyme [Desulfobaculum xiamenense]|uniref:Pyruvate formate lyase activating enzyme n=1 Tax=Desulfobaculum xiamenense TaxID=995050 RepID=A0A846QK39_9BACT|nr:AmmeMemoRadiSam system radical SAM enzyme [Desulfobaculum xiamenense]NJB67487.1 pyruvate formate lyase activating enzyme [Desulfobaculum xiamenense]
MREALLWKAVSGQRVQCRLCSHFCIIDDGARGTCGVRENRGGSLFTLADRIAALHIDPVEKKPLFHFLPGTETLSFAAMGCNFSCSWCQNYSLSQPPRTGQSPEGQPAEPQDLVDAALRNGCASISYTYSEPTVFFEIMLDTAKRATQRGLYNIMVSNGFQSPQCLDELAPYINAANIDLKSFSEATYRDHCKARLAPVLDNLRHMMQLGWWVEITTLVIPALNDSDTELTDIASFIAKELGPDVPWHISRFHPDFTMHDRAPTPVTTLERAAAIGRAAGLHYVYTGNVPGHSGENTVCPSCGATAIARRGFTLLSDPPHDTCPECGAHIPGVFE